MTPEEHRFDSAGTPCAAWLFRPPTADPVPCVVMAHGFGAVREAGLPGYAQRFAARGMAALVFDHRHLGASGGLPRQLVDVDAQLADWAAAVRYARTLSEVDSARIALWGTSFSGGHVLAVAARDPDIAAVVAQVPYLGLVRKRALPDRRVLRLAATALRDRVRSVRHPRDPVLLPLIGEPGSRALLQETAAERQFRALLPEEHTWVNAVAARVVLRLPGYRPLRFAARVRCPVLYCACAEDKVTPAALVAEAAAATPNGTLVEYPGEHFDIYRGTVFQRAVRTQAEFLARHLLDD
ncbi:alpha/beta hydrolase [Actinokineospora sp.]|uniref:alpha/beta hydrolase n=1 Tax=Actinokineospora sp. TaxID=1872133 RepID=UPI004037DFC4